MTRAHRQIAPEARHEDGEDGQSEPSPRAVSVGPIARARMVREVTFGVRHTVIQHALSARQARDGADARAHRIRSVLTTASLVLVLVEHLVTVFAAGPIEKQMLELVTLLGPRPLGLDR